MIYEPISETILSSFIVGLVIGMIARISKKIIMIIWISAVVLSVILLAYEGAESYAENLAWGVWNWIAMLVFVNIGSFLGYMGLDETINVFRGHSK